MCALATGLGRGLSARGGWALRAGVWVGMWKPLAEDLCLMRMQGGWLGVARKAIQGRLWPAQPGGKGSGRIQGPAQQGGLYAPTLLSAEHIALAAACLGGHILNSQELAHVASIAQQAQQAPANEGSYLSALKACFPP